MDQDIVERIRGIAERVGMPEGIEVVSVEFLGGSGGHRLLRVYIDKEAGGGVSHADCKFMSDELGTALDAEDFIPGPAGYHLEVSSPGVERQLSKPRDFIRFTGKKIKLSLREPVENAKRLEGTIVSLNDGVLSLETADGKVVSILLDSIAKANLKFEW